MWTFPGVESGTTYPSAYTITLTSVVVTSISQTDNANSAVAYNSVGLVENTTLTAQKFQFTFQPQLPNGQFNGAPKTIGFDCSRQQTF
jgi:hypothetical protein